MGQENPIESNVDALPRIAQRPNMSYIYRLVPLQSKPASYPIGLGILHLASENTAPRLFARVHGLVGAVYRPIIIRITSHHSDLMPVALGILRITI